MFVAVLQSTDGEQPDADEEAVNGWGIVAAFLVFFTFEAAENSFFLANGVVTKK